LLLAEHPPDVRSSSRSRCGPGTGLALSDPLALVICTPRRSSDMKRRVPRLATDEEADAFLQSDLSDLDFSQFKSGRLRLEAPSRSAREVSETYRLFEQAMIERKQIVCTYNGERREVCPVILGHSHGEERALTFQFGGESTSRKLPPAGDWRCLTLSNVSEIQLREGPWCTGDSHKQPSSCVQVVDLDINTESPYRPKRQVADLIDSRTTLGRNSGFSGRKRSRRTAKSTR
jgi:predicted DNA binding CopG/RHH family protein